MVNSPLQLLDPNEPMLSEDQVRDLQTALENIKTLRLKKQKLTNMGIASDIDLANLDTQERTINQMLANR